MAWKSDEVRLHRNKPFLIHYYGPLLNQVHSYSVNRYWMESLNIGIFAEKDMKVAS